MEAIIEIIIQVFGEIIIELFAYLVAFIFESFVVKIDKDDQFKNRIKVGLYYAFIGLMIVLVILSIIYQKTLIVIIALSYILLKLILKMLTVLYRDKSQKDPVQLTIKVFEKILNYVYPFILIIYGAIYLEHIGCKTSLIVFSSLVLLVLCLIDIYRLRRYLRKKKGKTDEK